MDDQELNWAWERTALAAIAVIGMPAVAVGVGIGWLIWGRT